MLIICHTFFVTKTGAPLPLPVVTSSLFSEKKRLQAAPSNWLSDLSNWSSSRHGLRYLVQLVRVYFAHSPPNFPSSLVTQNMGGAAPGALGCARLGAEIACDARDMYGWPEALPPDRKARSSYRSSQNGKGRTSFAALEPDRMEAPTSRSSASLAAVAASPSSSSCFFCSPRASVAPQVGQALSPRRKMDQGLSAASRRWLAQRNALRRTGKAGMRNTARQHTRRQAWPRFVLDTASVRKGFSGMLQRDRRCATHRHSARCTDRTDRRESPQVAGVAAEAHPLQSAV